MKALIWKELRENVRWLPVGLFVVGAVCWMVRPDRMNSQALIAMDLTTQLAIVTPLLAFALGIVQAYRDLQPAAGAYLSHRSVTADKIFLSKIISGFLLYGSAIAVPILALAGWIAYHGMQWHPMRPAQVLPAVVFGLASFVMHPAAMLMLARGASWWGTRLFPLVPAGAALIPFFIALRSGGLWGAGLGALVAIPMLAWMIAIARQGWRDFSSDPPAALINARLRGRWLLPSYLVLGMLVCVVTAMVFLLDSVRNWGRPRVYVPTPRASVAIDTTTNQPWLLTYLQQTNMNTGIQEESILGGDKIERDQLVDPMRSLEEVERFKELSHLSPVNIGAGTDGFFSSFNQLEGTPFSYSYDARGYLLCYSRFPEVRWTQTIAADGVYPAGQLRGVPFTSDAAVSYNWIFNSFRAAGYANPLIDTRGVYLLDNNPLSIRRLIDQPIDAAVLIEMEKDHAPRLILKSARRFLEYRFLDSQGSETWYRTPDSYDRHYYLPAPQKTLSEISLTAELVRTYELSPTMPADANWRVGLTDESLFAVAYDQPTRVWKLSPGEAAQSINFRIDPDVKSDAEVDRLRAEFVLAGLFPGIVGIPFAAVATWITIQGQMEPTIGEQLAQYPVSATTLVVSFIVVCLIAAYLSVRVARRRGLSRGQTRAWCWSVPLLGLAAPLSMIAIYRQVHREACPGCDRSRRVDMPNCEHCGAAWEPPAHEGIEIHDRQAGHSVSIGAVS